MQVVDSEITVSEIFDALPGGFFIYHADEGERIIFANKEAQRIFGCESLEEFKELTHDSFKGIVYPDDLPLVEESISQQIFFLYMQKNI